MTEPGTTLQFEIYTPNTAPITIEAIEVVLPGEEGVLTVLPQHTPLLTALRPGVMILIDLEGREQHYAIHGGFAEVSRDRILVLTESYEIGNDIDTERANASQKRAEERLTAISGDHDLARAETSLQRAQARLYAHSGEGY